ncbi:hypothetical protein Bbelb_071870 [Branchiostoma belcheri]|nr:hypothetical protein Bbelb_071870 [Branchiostoma belcheri]
MSSVTKASKRLFFISRLRRSGVPTTDLVSIFCGYIRPTLEYAAPCWSSALTQKQSDALERVQKRACRIILGRRYNSYTETLALLDLQRLADRREHLCSDFATSVEKSSRFRSWLPPYPWRTAWQKSTKCHEVPAALRDQTLHDKWDPCPGQAIKRTVVHELLLANSYSNST